MFLEASGLVKLTLEELAYESFQGPITSSVQLPFTDKSRRGGAEGVEHWQTRVVRMRAPGKGWIEEEIGNLGMEWAWWWWRGEVELLRLCVAGRGRQEGGGQVQLPKFFYPETFPTVATDVKRCLKRNNFQTENHYISNILIKPPVQTSPELIHLLFLVAKVVFNLNSGVGRQIILHWARVLSVLSAEKQTRQIIVN